MSTDVLRIPLWLGEACTQQHNLPLLSLSIVHCAVTHHMYILVCNHSPAWPNLASLSLMLLRCLWQRCFWEMFSFTKQRIKSCQCKALKVKVQTDVIGCLCSLILTFIFPELQAVAMLLGVEPTLLQQGLTLRTYHSERGEEVRSQCSAAAVSSHTH